MPPRSNNNATHNGRALTDEDLARALQRQYERELQQSSSRQQQQQSQSNNNRNNRATPALLTAPQRPSSLPAASRGGTSSSRQQRQQSSSVPPPPPPPQAPPAMSDEEYARRLQSEEQRARTSAQRALSRRQQQRDNRRSQQQQQQLRGTMVVLPSAPVETASMRGGQQLQQPSTRVVHMSDAELAQQIMAQERQKAAARNQTPLTSRESSLVSQQDQQEYFVDDEELAMRMEQEFRDEEIARRIQTNERDRIAAQHAQAAQRVAPGAEQAAPKRGCTFRRCCSFLFTLVLLGGAAAGMIYYFLIMGNELPDWIPTPQDFANEDPFDAKKPSEANAWQNDGNGIQLEVLNALDEYWYPYFNQAVRDWDNGYPDALTLLTSVRDPESSCQTVNGKVKVCNGNYGNTHWKGINEVLIDRRGNIFASSARMNEYYLGGAPNGGDPDQMQYTMCHEIGHAWGLPHTDESFTNKDLGNCMDYTNNPENNKTPDLSNYQFLHALYGLVPGAAPYTAPTMAPTTAGEKLSTSAAVNDGDNDFEDENDGPPPEKKSKQKSEKDRGQQRNRRAAQVHETTPDEPLADWLQASVDAAKAKLEAVDATVTPEGGKRWRLLKQSAHGESHEIELEKGYRFQVHKLYP